MTERWAKYADRPNLRQALMLADERARSSASPTDVLRTEHIVLLGKRLASRHNSVARAVADALRAAGIPFVLTLVGAHNSWQRFLRIRILEGEEARTERMRRLMVRHEMEPDERPAIEAQMVALDAEMEGRT